MKLRLRGVITIYLSLTLVLTSALIFTLIESARVSSMNAKLQSITYMACDSVFSGFAEPVFDRYGVMLLWEDEEEFLEDFKEYCSENLKTADSLGLLYSDIYRASLASAELTDKKAPTDNGGQVFADQVYEYMDYYLYEDAAERILDNVSIFDQGNKVDEFMDKIESYRDVFTRVEDSVSDLKKTIDSVKKIVKDPAELLGDASESLERYSGGDTSAASSFRSALSKLKSAKNDISKGLDKIQKGADKYYENVEDAQAAVSELENDLTVDREDYDDEIYEVVSEQVEDIRQKSADTDFDYYLVGANEDLTGSLKEDLNSLDSLFDSTEGALTEENAEEYKAIVDSFRNRFTGFSLDGLGVNLDTTEVEKEDDSFLSSISDLFNSGILGFVAGEVSDRTVDSSGFPSSDISGSADQGEESLVSATTDKALFGEYILQHFGNCADEDEDSALVYETEYIIAGKDSDRDNLSAVVADIVLVRSGCNLISILKSPSKKAETYALATSLVGFTGMPVVIKIFQILVMAAWALAESMADVKALIGGHKIKTIKDDSDWYLSLAGIKNFSADALSPSGNERGLSYESYLRLLLLMQNREKQYFRTMDMIQANMCLSENEDFRISECMSSVTVNAEFSSQQLFVSFPFVQRVVGHSHDGWKYSMTQEYSY